MASPNTRKGASLLHPDLCGRSSSVGDLLAVMGVGPVHWTLVIDCFVEEKLLLVVLEGVVFAIVLGMCSSVVAVVY